MSETSEVDNKSELPLTSASNFVPGGNLYTDFSSDTIPTPVQPVQTTMVQISQLKNETHDKDDRTVEEQPKKLKRRDWIDTENPLHCKPCDFTAQNMEEFQDHSLSYKHIKKTAEVLEIKVNSKKDEEKKKQTSFTCENLEKQGAAKVFQKQRMKCGSVQAGGGPIFHNTQYSHGYKPYQKQAYSTPPQFNLPNPGIHCANDFAQYKEPLIGLEYVTEIQVTGQNPRYHCKLCDAKFDHNVKFPHLVGAKHRFNVLKEKNPAIAQEIRLGVKKRSELTGKLLEEAMKIEQQEGRQQVKTCIEASPFDTVTSTTTQGGGFPVDRQTPFTAQGRGRGFGAQSRPYQKNSRGHPLKGSLTHPLKGGQKRSPNPMNYQNQYPSDSGYGTNNPGYGGNATSYGAGLQYQGGGMRGGGMRGRGGNGRGRGGSNQGYGRGYKQNKQASSFTSTESTYQQYNPGFNSGNQNQSSSTTMLPREAFTPRSPPRSQSNYSHFNQHVGSTNPQPTPRPHQGQTGTQANKWNEPADLAPQSAPQAPPSTNPTQPASTSKTTDSSTQNLLKGLTDLGKLVSSEEDASIALQVSNALTQALLQYRMQNLEEGQK